MLAVTNNLGPLVGGVFLIGGFLWLWGTMLMESWLWGIGVLFLPLLTFVFLFCHFKKAILPIGIMVIGVLILHQTNSLDLFAKRGSPSPTNVAKSRH
jgi:hypothetical protein